jgi:hypothetical protein
MEYGNIIRRSVNIVWQNKYLILLGILAALGSGSGGGGGGGGGGSGSSAGNGTGQLPQFSEQFSALAVGAIIVLICVALFVGILLWAISAIARGGLIASVDTIEEGGKSSFSHGWRAAREKMWTLFGIGLLPGIPGLILFVAGLMAFAAYGGVSALLGERFAAPAGMAGLGGLIALVACVVVPIILLLTILRSFAERAAMLEGLGVVDAYRRGWNVLVANLGEAIVLFLLQIAVFIALGIFLLVPGIILALCCLFWPLLLAVQGAISAVVSAIWTLAWREWTGGPKLVEKAPTAF